MSSERSPQRAARASEIATAPPLDPAQAHRLAEILQTLGDPTRLRILTALETVCVPVAAIAAATGIPQPSISHHLRILRDRGVVRGARRGSMVYYCLQDSDVLGALGAIRSLGALPPRPTLGVLAERGSGSRE